MTVTNKSSKKNSSPKSKVEERLDARPVSRGSAIGKIVCLYGRRRQFYRYELDDSQIARELRRYRAAVRLAANQLKKIGKYRNDQIKQTRIDIFSAHLLILEDESLHAKIEAIIEREKINAEWAVKTVTEDYVAKYKAISDEYLRERYIDLEDVADRILTALGGGSSPVRLEKNSIIVAEEVKPSTLVELAESQPRAIVTENGGWTSHTFILAREMNLPAVTGVKKILRQVRNGDQMIVDGFGGKVILHPGKKTIESYAAVLEESNQSEPAKNTAADGFLKTLDGCAITIRANIDLPKGYAQAKRFGAKGVGLYRSEFLFNQYKGFPSEVEQINAYGKIAALVGADGVRIRTFDLSVEQLADETPEREKNPALGLRGVRLGFAHPKEFRTQIRALLQSSVENNIHIVLPMISDVAEIAAAKTIIKRQKIALQKKRIKTGDLRLGAMIEVPSAVLTIEEIAAEVDFLCLGTNDLVQYLLAVDRDNETVADWFRTLHPAVLRAVKTVLRAAERRGIPVTICGEMAGSPVYVPVLLGLGAIELSMNLNSIPRVSRIVAGIALEEARELVADLETCRTADAVEAAVTDFYRHKWSHLFPKDIFPPRKK